MGERADTLNIHARWCSGGCPRWLATGAPSCMPYPCRCAETKANAPQFVKDWGEVTCWWRKKTTGELTSRCPCWGDEREGKPDGCCSWHMANPRFLDDRHAAFLALVADANPADQAADGIEIPGGPAGWHAPHDPLLWDADDGEPWADRRRRWKPYVRRWKPEELVCAHDPAALPKGVHCVDCCVTFGSEIAYSMHRKAWTEPCREPSGIVDVDTGAALLTYRHDGVWALDWAANVPRWLAVKTQSRRSA